MIKGKELKTPSVDIWKELSYANLARSENWCFSSVSGVMSANEREKIVTTMKILMKKLRRLVNLRACKDLGNETGNNRPKQNMVAQILSP